MKKTYLIAGSACAILLAYPISAYVFGNTVENKFNLVQEKLKAQNIPGLKVIKKRKKKGIFGAVEQVEYEIDLSMGGNDPASKINVATHTTISHGPLPDFSSVGGAKIHSKFMLSGEVTEKVLKDLNLASATPFLTTETLINFDGSSTSKFNSPAVKIDSKNIQKAKDPNSTEPEHAFLLDWQGLSGTAQLTKDMNDIRLQITFPGLNITSTSSDPSENFTSTLGTSTIEVKQKLVSLQNTQNDSLSVGKSSLVVDHLDIKLADGDEIKLGKLNVSTDTPIKDGFVDINFNSSLEKLGFKNIELGPIRYDYGLRHLQVQAFATAVKEYQTLALNTIQNPNEMYKPGPELIESLKKLGSEAPEYHIDRISLATEKGGEAFANLHLKLAKINIDEIITKGMKAQSELLGKISLTAEVNVPESLIADLNEKLAKANDEAPTSQQALEQGYQMITMGDYVTRSNGVFSSKLKLENSKLSANEKEIPLSALLSNFF